MTVVSDNFNRAALGANWTSDSGAWSIGASTYLLQTTTGGNYKKCRWAGAALAGTNNYAQALCKNDSIANGPGVFVRGTAAASVTYYAVEYFKGDSDYLVEITAGGEGVLDTGAGRAGASYTLRIEASGNNLSGLVNGGASTSAIDASLAGNAGVGAMVYGVLDDAATCIDDWEAGDLGGAGIANKKLIVNQAINRASTY